MIYNNINIGQSLIWNRFSARMNKHRTVIPTPVRVVKKTGQMVTVRVLSGVLTDCLRSVLPERLENDRI